VGRADGGCPQTHPPRGDHAAPCPCTHLGRGCPWRDHRDQPVEVPEPARPREPAFYVPIGEFQGSLYRRNAFAAHTDVEVAALLARTGLIAGQTVVDVGCGDGRHLRALARRGINGIGVDVSPALVEAARDAAAAESDAWPDGTTVRFRWPMRDTSTRWRTWPGGGADVAWALCQGAFGTHPDSDPDVLAGLAGCVRPGGLVVVTAFHALFAVRHLVEGDAFDPTRLLHHQVSEVRGPDDTRAHFDLWTAAYTVRDLVCAGRAAGLEVIEVVGAEPGRYDATEVRLDDPELLLVARRR
jgi:SAM-dependent methyltransferase